MHLGIFFPIRVLEEIRTKTVQGMFVSGNWMGTNPSK
jgi:hypothetical protein